MAASGGDGAGPGDRAGQGTEGEQHRRPVAGRGERGSTICQGRRVERCRDGHSAQTAESAYKMSTRGSLIDKRSDVDAPLDCRQCQQIITRGNFALADVVRALDNNAGIEDAALLELQKNQLKPFLMRIWGPPVGVENDEAAPHEGQRMPSRQTNYFY